LSRLIAIFVIFFLGCPLWARIQYRILADIPQEAALVDSIIQESLARLDRLIDSIQVDSLDVYIVKSHKKFDSLAGNTIPDWGVGVAIPHRYRIVIKSPLITPGDKTLGELTAHEFTHIALANAVGFRRLPRWFDEGMAMYISTEWSWSDNLATSWAVVFGGEILLSEIENLSRFEGEMVRVAYSESYLAFKYFLDTYGHSGLNIFLDRIKAGDAIDNAFIVATGANHDSFQAEFKIHLSGRYNLIALIFDSNLLWILMGLVVIIGFIITRLNRKRRIRRLEEYDMLHSTDFDYGEKEKPDEDKPWD
jgi:hypothetical protein